MSVVVLQASKDTYIADNHPNTNYGTKKELLIGKRNRSPFDRNKGLIQFDLSSIPSDVVISAAILTLYFREDALWGSDQEEAIQAYRLLRDWTELGATWDDYASGLSWTTPGAEGAGDFEGTKTGDVAVYDTYLKNDPLDIPLVADLVQDWIDGGLANRGLVLRTKKQLYDLFSFYSSDYSDPTLRPTLTITYIISDDSIAVGLQEKSQVLNITDGVVAEYGSDDQPLSLIEFADVVVAGDATIEWTEDTFETPIVLRVNNQYATPGLRVETVEINEELNALNTLRCQLVNPTRIPEVGHVIELLHGCEPYASTKWTQSGLTWFSEININDGLIDDICFRVDNSGVGSWLKLTLGVEQRRAFRSCRIYAQGSHTAIWDVEFSDNDVDWTRVATGWNTGLDGTLSSATWTDFGSHRHWRLYKTNAAGAGSNGILEVQWSTEPQMVLFHGTIDEITKVSLEPNVGTVYSLNCVDWNQLADRALVVEEYEDILAGNIVKDAVADHLVGDNVTTAFVYNGPLITKIVANYITVVQLLTEIAELTGFWWNIDYDKRMHFEAMFNRVSPFVLSSVSAFGVEATALSASVSARTTREQYRNHQFIRAGFDITDVQTETFLGDGQRKTFTVGFPLALVPVVDVDGVVKTIGVRGVDTGYEWYWNKESNEISQDSSGTALTNVQVLKVEYQGLFPVIVEIQDSGKISERQGVEGGSGVYQNVEDFEHLDGQTIATDKAVALLRKYGRLPTKLSFETHFSGLQAGQLLSVAIPELNLSGAWLIESMTIEDLGADRLIYKGTAVDGEHLGGWVEFFRKFSDQGGIFTARQNEVLQTINSESDTIDSSDVLTPVEDSTTTEWEVDTAEIGFSEVT